MGELTPPNKIVPEPNKAVPVAGKNAPVSGKVVLEPNKTVPAPNPANNANQVNNTNQANTANQTNVAVNPGNVASVANTNPATNASNAANVNPAATTNANVSNTASANPTVSANSASSVKNLAGAPVDPQVVASLRQPVDFFAEQNQKSAERKQKLKKALKWVIPVAAVLVMAAIGVAVFFIVRSAKNSNGPVVDDTPVDETREDAIEASLKGVEKLNTTVNEVYKPTYTINESGEVTVDGDLAAAEATFEAAMKNPANKNRLNTIRLAQIVFYTSIMDYQKVVDVAADVDASWLNSSEQLRFYNLTYLAYKELGNEDEAGRYYVLMRDVADKVKGYVGD